MEVPVVIVVQVVDAERGRPLAVELVTRAQVGAEELREALVGETVRIAVVERAELGSGKAGAVGQGQLLTGTPAGVGPLYSGDQLELVLANKLHIKTSVR